MDQVNVLALQIIPTHLLNVPSGGAGRTGVFVVLSVLLERMRYEGLVDVYQTITLLRTQRPGLVCTEVRIPVMYYSLSF